MNLAERVRAGETVAIARAMSVIENEQPEKETLIDALSAHCGAALVLGVTGPPGSGKSSLVDQLIRHERRQGRRVGVIAVDPSSPFSGGAILGDRLRMQSHAIDDGVFIRSMASRGHLGGVAGATADAIKVLDAAGFDRILVETMGVGQSEIEVMELADIVLLVLVPGLGDEIQALKAGIMEIGDIFVINKSDKPEAAKVRAQVEYVLGLAREQRKPPHPVVMTSAINGQGIDELAAAIEDYHAAMVAEGLLTQIRRQRIARELLRIIAAKVQQQANSFLDLEQHLDTWVQCVLEKRCGPYALVTEHLNNFLQERTKR
ncbi:MAG: methylmalonyl Co-A mutase-associated GTPase MeaB [candidate division KSB1 bacterium]|nr:methylmalonyl Co-A mutase-associated GTPase MeaB [candidate division KSB1 bacterium]MDZ7385069.1 methylmalonyl Co-A mutase-associated GTPase MeaB [candidate division KSB1 bacterium]MDZ7392607.1 methylmalonyl Co-A mutase-associated GTPase MeaB [candidate division KSB1 bacterium]